MLHPPTEGPWAALAVIAEHQRGLITDADIAEVDLRDHQVEHAVRTRRLTRLYRGVYAFGHCQLRDEGWLLAGLRTADPEAALCSWTAAWWWGITEDAPARVDVAMAGRSSAAVCRHGLVLDPRDVVTGRGLRVTTVARTLLDVAREPDGDDRVQRLLEEAAFRRLLKTEAIPALLQRTRGHHGARRLREITRAISPRWHSHDQSSNGGSSTS